MNVFEQQETMMAQDSLAVLAIIALVLIAGIVATVVMLIIPKTRVAGILSLLIGTVVVMVVVMMVVSRFGVERRHHAATAESHAELPRRYATEATQEATERYAERTEKRPTTDAADNDLSPAPSGSAPSEPAEADVARAPPEKDESPTPEPEKTVDESDSADEPVITVPPPWINTPPQLVGDVYQMTIKTDPRESPEDFGQLPAKLNDAVRRYATTMLNRDPWVAGRVQLDWPYLNRNILQQTWSQPVLGGDWFEVHALLQFDGKARRDIEQQCEEVIVTRRLWYTGVGFAALVALLGVSLGSLKIDQAAGGSCRGRLGLGAVVAVLALGWAVYAAAALIDEPQPANVAPISTERTIPAELTTGEVQY